MIQALKCGQVPETAAESEVSGTAGPWGAGSRHGAPGRGARGLGTERLAVGRGVSARGHPAMEHAVSAPRRERPPLLVSRCL